MSDQINALVVEDRAADAELMVRELKKAGFEPQWRRVTTEPELRRRLDSDVDLVLADYSLPGWNAKDALKVMDEEGMDAPLIVVSGSIGEEEAVSCLRHGAADYILKDRMARLGPAVKRALAERTAARQADRADAALRDSEERLRSILGTLQDTVFSMSLPDKRLLYVSPASTQMLGAPPERFLEDPDLLFSMVEPDDREPLRQEQEQSIKKGSGQVAFRTVHPDGSIRHLEARMWTSADVGGQLRLEGILRDLTEARRAEQDRLDLEREQQRSAKLQELERYKTQFLHMVAHDLSNVLTPMRFSSEILRELPEEVIRGRPQKALEILDLSISRLGHFLADILDAARLQSGRLDLHVEAMDLCDSLRQALELSAVLAHEANVELDADLPEELVVVADPHRVAQIVSNLLSNALKFTPENGRVVVRATRRNGMAEFSVQDSGPGIREEDVRKLFQPFSQLTAVPRGKDRGTGLGLYICHGIVEEHGGTIECTSPGLGHGATFTVRLPVVQEGAERRIPP